MGVFEWSWILLLDMINDFDGEILYHPSKVNVVVNVVSRKPVGDPLRELHLRMIMFTHLMDLISKTHDVLLVDENAKCERV